MHFMSSSALISGPIDGAGGDLYLPPRTPSSDGSSSADEDDDEEMESDKDEEAGQAETADMAGFRFDLPNGAGPRACMRGPWLDLAKLRALPGARVSLSAP